MKLRSLIALGATWLAACASRETIPTLRVKANPSGIEVVHVSTHGPKGMTGGVDQPPDIPSGLSAQVRRVHPSASREPRYLIRAWGGVQVVSLERTGDYARLGDTLQKWRQALDSARQGGALTVLNSEIPPVNASQSFRAKVRYRSYPWGEALLFLTTYVNGATGAPYNNEMLVLTVQGFTHDGRYAVKANFEIRHPKLPDSMWDKRTKGKAVFQIDDVNSKIASWLNRQPDTSFQPSFERYDTFLRALIIEPPAG